ncbi:MAG: replication-associated recombination protein A [Bacilli bacterium]|nr:replication-associated recombination protein A [Bacilli bacterium]
MVGSMEILANELRPKKLEDVLGQDHIIGKGKIINNLIKNKKMFSMILYGKPGIGKTTIAQVIANELELPVRFLNATVNNKQDFDIVIAEAKMEGTLLLVVDEIHRMNKDKQDILLPHIENGTIILIGLTTSNPYHKINPAIRSRCQIFELKSLTNDDIIKGLNKGVDYLKDIKITDEELKYIAALSNGDIRSAYNILEMAYYSTTDHEVTIDLLKKINSKPVFFHDKNETGHYDTLSAFQKSIRGSDPDAAIHYLCRLLYVGDLDSVYRRLSVIAYEDIGLANPSIGPKLHAAIEASELVGMPECIIILGEIVIEMALSPKSNSASSAALAAYQDIENGITGDIPENIRIDTKTYKYPHDYPKSWVKQEYMPKNLKNRKYYNPRFNKYEANLYKAYEEMRNE